MPRQARWMLRAPCITSLRGIEKRKIVYEVAGRMDFSTSAILKIGRLVCQLSQQRPPFEIHY